MPDMEHARDANIVTKHAYKSEVERSDRPITVCPVRRNN